MKIYDFYDRDKNNGDCNSYNDNIYSNSYASNNISDNDDVCYGNGYDGTIAGGGGGGGMVTITSNGHGNYFHSRGAKRL